MYNLLTSFLETAPRATLEAHFTWLAVLAADPAPLLEALHLGVFCLAALLPNQASFTSILAGRPGSEAFSVGALKTCTAG